MVGSDNESDDASVHNETTNTQQQPNIQPQIITTVSNNNAKFPYLKKDEYERESKVRATLLQSILDDHVANFHYMNDARDIWNAVKARFGGTAKSKKMRKSTLKQEFSEFRIGEAEGLHKGYDRMQKILSQLNQLKAKPEDEDINLKFLRALPSSWSQVALTLKTKGGLELLYFNDLYYKLKTLEVDVKGYTTFSSSHSAFVSATSASKKMSYGHSPSYSSTTTYSAPSNSKTGSYRSGNIHEDVLQSFVADTKPEQQLAYEDFEQIEKLDLEEMDLKWQMAMLSVRVHKFEQKAKRKIKFDKKESARFNNKKIKEIRKKEEESKALITVDTLVDWTDHDSKSDRVIAAKEFGMIVGYDSENAIEEGAAKIYNLITRADTEEASIAEKQKKVLQRNQLTLEDKIRVLSIELENTSNLLKHSKRINADVETAKKQLKTKLDNHLVQTEKWRNSSKNLFRLIDSSMSVRIKVGLGFNNCIRENELGWDDFAFSVFTTNSKNVEGRPLFHRFAKADSMKVVPPPLSRDYTSLSDHNDLDESQMSYGTKSSTSSDSKSVSNDFVSCDDSDKSLEVNTNNFASSDSSVKSSDPKSNDSTSCASTSSVSASENEAEIESNNEHTSRTSCNKNGYFNKKAGHFRKNALSVSKLCFVCGSGTHLIKDCDFYEKQMANKTVGIGVGPVHSRNKVNHQHQFVPQVVLLMTGKVNIPPARPQPVPTGKPKVFASVPIGWPNRPFPVPTDRGYSPSENPFSTAKDERIFDIGCSRSMLVNKERLDDFQKFQGGKVMFGGGDGRITGKGTIRTPTLDFENVYYVKELQQFNLFSISQIYDKKSQVLFRDTECLVLSKDFKLPDESMVVLRVPRKHNLYTINLNNLSPRGNLACLVAHASVDESVKWHRRMGHVNYKNMNRLAKGNLVRGLPPKLFKNDHTCVACCKEFKNALMIKLCGSKRIKREYSNVRTPQQNKVAERKNRTLIEAARTMLADSKLPTMFWTKAVRTACYVLNRVSVTRPHNKTPYALLTGNIPSVSQFKPFWCHVTILNTSDHLGKFDKKADEGYIVGYSASNKAYRVYNMSNKRVEETMNLRFLEAKPNVQGLGHEWYFDLNYLTDTLGYKHVQANQSAGTQGAELARLKGQEQRATSDATRLGLWFVNDAEELQKRASAKIVPPGSILVPTGSIPVPACVTMVSTDNVPVHSSSSTDSFFYDEPTTRFPSPSDLGNHDPSHGIFSCLSYDDEVGAALNNVASTVEVSSVATTQINTIHPQSLIIGDLTLAVQTRRKLRPLKIQAELMLCRKKCNNSSFRMYGFLLICLKGHRQEEGIDYDEVFDPVARIEAIRLFLAFASYMGFMVYYMDVKSAFLYGRIDKELQELGMQLFTFLLKHGYKRGTIEKTLFPKKNNRDIILVQVYVDDIIFGSTKKAWCDEFEAWMNGEFQMSAMGELTFFLGLQVQQRPDGIFINQDKYVQEILNKFDLRSVRTVTTPYEATKPKSKNEYDSPVNVHLYRSMIGSLMYLTASRPAIMFAVSACSRNQVAPSNSNLEAVKKIFKYLKGQPKLGLCASIPSAADRVPTVSTLHSDHQPAQNLNPNSTSSVAALRYKDEHNKVGYILKPTGSDDYHQIINFLRASHIRYALTHNPVIFDSLVKQFWSIVMLGSPELGPPAIQATIDKTPFTITEDLVRSRLQLADDGGIADLPIAEIFFGMDNLSYVTEETRIKRQYKVLMFSRKLFANMRLNFEGNPMLLLPAMLLQAQAGEGAKTQILIPSLALMRQLLALSPMRKRNLWVALLICLHQGPLKLLLHVNLQAVQRTLLQSSVVSTLVNKVNSLETKLKDHKKLFKDVVGKLVKKVKAMEQDVDLDDLRALANAVVTVDSNLYLGGASNNPAASTSVPTVVPTGATVVPAGASTIPPGTLTIPAGSPSAPVDVPSSIAPTGVSSKGKYPMEAAKRLHDEEQAQMDSQRAEVKRRQHEVLNSAMYYNKANWITIRAQIDANVSLSKTLLGDDVSEDNFPVRMAALIKRKRQALVEKLAQERQNRPITQAQQRAYMRQYIKNQKFEKIREVQSNSQLQAFSRTLKRTGPVLEEPSSISSVPDVPRSPVTFIKVVTTEDSDNEAPTVWSALVGWEIIPTPLGDINALYRMDQSTKHFTTLRQILHMVDRQDLVKLYRLVVQYYETHPVAGVGLILWGDIQVLFDSHKGDISYPLSVKLIEKMLRYKLEIDTDVVGNDMTTADQLIQFIKNQLAAA
nr:putative ribonuclease H-like domain-containing protein [Tanacetum cinerariifolium]